MEEQNFVDPTPTGEGIIRRKLFAVLKTTLIVVSFAIVSIIIFLLFSITFNLYHLFHVSGILPRLMELIAHPAYLLSSPFLLSCIVVFAIFVIVWLGREPISIFAYLRYVKSTQERYFEVYTPLKALPDAYRTPVTHISEESSGTPLSQEIDILDLAKQMDRHLLLLGLPGAGKTMFLRYYQYTLLQQNTLLQQTWEILIGNKKVPVFVFMKDYSLYVDEIGMSFFERESPLLDFLYMREQGIGYMRHYLKKLKKQGRLMFLCDGINEVDSKSLTWVCNELISLMRESRCQLVMTCRELEYTVEQDIQRLVIKGEAARALIHPLKPEAIKAFVTKYVEKQGNTWKHKAELICQRIENTRLSIHCTNPFMLFTFMEIIDRVGIDGEDPLDTRGLLLQEYVSQKIDAELKEGKWSLAEFRKEDVLEFLSEIACAARWANERNAIYLSPLSGRNKNLTGKDISDEEAAVDLLHWLDDNLAQGPLTEEDDTEHERFHNNIDSDKLTQLLQFAKTTDLIVATSYNRVLSFRHELIAEYFVARYFHAVDSSQARIWPLRKELLGDVGKWSEPIALWAGLINNPLHLADRIAQLVQHDQDSATEALMLSLVCISVEWHPPQNNVNRPIELPQSVKENLAKVVQHSDDRERVARLFDRCAAEGGVEVYHALLPLLTISGIDRLMILLNTKVVPELLFTHLENSVHTVHYQTHVEALERILGAFGQKVGKEVIARAEELSKDTPQRNPLLRISAVKILGNTNDQRAVEPIMALLSDAQDDIVKVSLTSLASLGPNLVLDPTIKELRNYSPTHFTYKRHWAALTILYTFLKASKAQYQLKDVQYQQVLEVIISVLSSNYLSQIQKIAGNLLIEQGKDAANGAGNRRENVVKLLLPQLSSIDTDMSNNVVQTLKEIGEFATPYLIDQLKRQPAEIVRVRIIDVFGYVHDPRALETILSFVADQSQEVFYQVKFALHHYSQQPECISGVIRLVLYNSHDDVANKATDILEGFGEIAVGSVIQVLPQVVHGRTQLLVRVLEKVHDADAVPALIALLEMSQVRNDISLGLSVVHALGQFRDARVVSPLLQVAGISDIRLYEEAIEALSFLGEVAFDGLIAALNIEAETVATPRIRKALLDMDPFPSERLFDVFAKRGDILAQQIRIIFHEKGFPAAQILLQHLFYPDIRVQGDVGRTLYAMDRYDVIPAFTEKLSRPTPEFLNVANQYLKQYDESIPPLVSLLGNPEASDAATTILLDIGLRILPFMVNGLNEHITRKHSQQIIKTLGLRQPEIFPNIIGLFALIASKGQLQRARDALLDLLTEDHPDVIIPYLLEALESEDLVKDVTDALLTLSRRHETKDAVIDGLVKALEQDKRRNGAEKALVRLEDLAVNPVSELIAHPDLSVDNAAQRILMKIGVPAFPVIWSLHSDTRNPQRQAAAQKILYAMPTEVIKDKLVELLSSDEAKNIEMALTLLMELIQNENLRPPGSQAMIPALLAYIQKGGAERMSLRIIALLLLLDRSNVVDYLIQALRDNPQHEERLVQAFLLLNRETTGKVLQEVLQDTNGKISLELRAELIGVLGMIKVYPIVDNFAKNSGAYGLWAGGGQVNNPKQLAISLRAIGGLLASGHWNLDILRNLRLKYEEGKPERELFDILLGDLYSPRIKKINEERLIERATHDEALQSLNIQSNIKDKRIKELKNSLALVKSELIAKETQVENLKLENQRLKNSFNGRPRPPI